MANNGLARGFASLLRGFRAGREAYLQNQNQARVSEQKQGQQDMMNRYYQSLMSKNQMSPEASQVFASELGIESPLGGYTTGEAGQITDAYRARQSVAEAIKLRKAQEKNDKLKEKNDEFVRKIFNKQRSDLRTSIYNLAVKASSLMNDPERMEEFLSVREELDLLKEERKNLKLAGLERGWEEFSVPDADERSTPAPVATPTPMPTATPASQPGFLRKALELQWNGGEKEQDGLW